MSNTAALNYTMGSFTGVRNHADKSVAMIRDMASEPHKIIDTELEAEVKSGDYFITLATKLDQLNPAIKDYATRAAIEDAVSDLIYLYDHYAIQKRESDLV